MVNAAFRWRDNQGRAHRSNLKQTDEWIKPIVRSNRGIFLQGPVSCILGRMDSLRCLVFTPVPLRTRCDGWSPDVQLRFIRLLAEGAKPGEAAAMVGKNRQNAYALRRRPGAQSFADAWDAAASAGGAVRASRSGKVPKPVRKVIPKGPQMDAAVERSQRQIEAAATPDEARAALGRMLDALYGPRDPDSDKSDKDAAEKSSPGGPHFPQLPRQTVAFPGAPLRRRSCR